MKINYLVQTAVSLKRMVCKLISLFADVCLLVRMLAGWRGKGEGGCAWAWGMPERKYFEQNCMEEGITHV